MNPRRYILALLLSLSLPYLLAGCFRRLPMYTLLINVQGSGTVTPSTGSKYTKGSVAVLTPTPGADSIFVRWGGADGPAVVFDQASRTYRIYMDGPKSVTAVFAPSLINVAASPTSAGTVEQARVSETDNNGESVFEIRLTPRPAVGWIFDHWEGDLSGNADPASVTASRAMNITAVFTRLQFNLTVTVSGQGTVTQRLAAPASLRVKSAYDSGATVELSATPDIDWRFGGWGGDFSGTAASRTILLDSHKDVTAYFTPIVAGVAAGWSHSAAITPSGSLYTWGNNLSGELGIGSNVSRNTPVLVSALPAGDPVVAVALGTNTGSGSEHTLALLSSGAVYSWGLNSYGQVGDGSTVNRNLPARVAALPGDIVAVAAGAFHTVALTSGGVVYAWGDNRFGQLGLPRDAFLSESRAVPDVVPGLPSASEDRVVAIASGGYFNVALTETGAVYTWGHNRYGQVGAPPASTPDGYRSLPAVVSGLPDKNADPSVAIAAGRDHVLVLTRSGALYSWGRNDFGEVGVPPEGSAPTTDYNSGAPARYEGSPRLVDNGLPAGITAMGAGRFSTIVLTPSGIYSWGSNMYGQLGQAALGTGYASYRAVRVSGLPGNAVKIAAGREHSVALMDSGAVYAWGWNREGQLGDGTNTNQIAPVPVLAWQ